jgi:hypothetical protein
MRNPEPRVDKEYENVIKPAIEDVSKALAELEVHKAAFLATELRVCGGIATIHAHTNDFDFVEVCRHTLGKTEGWLQTQRRLHVNREDVYLAFAWGTAEQRALASFPTASRLLALVSEWYRFGSPRC